MSRITQRGATGPISIVANGAFQTSTDASLATLVGTRWDLSDGREVKLVSASSATTVAPGKVYQNAANVAAHTNIAVTAFTAYSANGNVPAKVTVTLGATAVTANQYAGGFVTGSDGTGEGQTVRIASHPAADASATLAITLEESPTVAFIASDSEVTLIAPDGKDIIITPTTTSTSTPTGVGLYAIPASSYGFLVTKGITTALADSTNPVIGNAIAASKITAGAVGSVSYAGNVLTDSVIGTALVTGVSTEYRPIYVNL